MSATYDFGLALLLLASVGMAALLSSRLTERIRIPAPLLVLVAAAVAVKVIPGLAVPPQRTVEQVVTLALVGILFDGGLHIGARRLRGAAGPIGVVGIVGTFLTVALTAAFIHVGFGIDWYRAFLIGTAVAPTDPAVVFSVLGKREVSGRSGTILEGESGANDPVGIALMASLLSAGALSGGAFLRVGGEFMLQMGVGALVGLVAGRGLLWFLQSVPLPSEALYPLRATLGAFMIFGIATVAYGSGFLAVFVAGIVIGDARAPYKAEVERFQAALASLGEIVAFVMLGLTVDLAVLSRADVWIPGLVIGVVLAAVIRPFAVGLCLLPSRLRANERNFILFAGLKGAVPILLGDLVLAHHVPDSERLYGIVVVVVVFSVAVQGSLTPAFAHRMRLPMRTVEPEPWALGVRLREEPDGVHRITIGAGSPADGCRVADLTQLPADAWISLAVRANQLLPIHGSTELRAGDELLILADRAHRESLRSTFVTRAPDPPPDAGT